MFNDARVPIYAPDGNQKRMPTYEQRQTQHLARFRVA